MAGLDGVVLTYLQEHSSVRLTPGELSYGLRLRESDSDQLNEALGRLTASGDLEYVRGHYGVPYVPPPSAEDKLKVAVEALREIEGGNVRSQSRMVEHLRNVARQALREIESHDGAD